MGAKGSGRKKKEQPKRISGTGYDIKTQPGAAAITHLKYKRQDKQTKLYEIDTETIKQRVSAYIEENAHKPADENTGVEERHQKPISRIGLRIALDIGRDTYTAWAQGYVDRADIDDENTTANIALAEAIRAGDDRILQYLVETNDKYGDTKRIRLLETYGEIGPAQSKVDVSATVNLGKWRNWAK